MIARLVIIVSFAANLALAALVVHAVQARHAAAPVVSRTVRTTTASATGVAPTQENVSAESDAPFRWAQLADADFKVYRDRLRAFGCPEQTVRDIIISEINEYFSGRCAALLADVQARFWEIAVHARDSEMDKAPWVVAMEALGKERDELVESVLGEDTTKKDKAREKQVTRAEQRYSWLPEEKRKKLIALEIETRDKVMALAKEIEQRPGVKWTDADKARRTALRKEAETARDRLLTPEEQAELKLRNSGESRWAQNLSGFEATQDEWHAVTQLKITNRDAVKSLNDAKLPDAERQAKTEAMDAELNSAIRASLGAERFAQMESAKDGDFQNARRVTKRYGLNDSLARETAQLQKTAVANAKLVRDDATLSPEARASTLAAIAQESRRTLTATLGSRVFTTYEKYSGDWLKELTHTPDENSGQ